MGKFDGVLLVSDFDDTLYAPDVAVPERNVSAIRYFTGEGGASPWPPAGPTAPLPPMSTWSPSTPGDLVQRGGHL